MSMTAPRTTTPLRDDLRGGVAAFARRAELRLDGDGEVAISIGDETTTVPAPVAEAMLDVLDRLARGRRVVVTSVDDYLTTGQAARMLGVSRTYVCRLLDDGRLPFEFRGTHRRVRTDDVLDYLRVRRAERREALDEVSRISRAAGLYDDDEI